MPTNQQTDDLRAVLCGCVGEEWHLLGEQACTVTVKPGTYGSWKPPVGQFNKRPRIPVEDIYVELARRAPDRATAKQYRSQAATLRHSAKYHRSS